MNMRVQSISVFENLDFPNCQFALRFLRKMPVILSSGYAISGQATRMMQKGGNGFIQKPFTFYALSEKIRKTRDAVKNAPQDG